MSKQTLIRLVLISYLLHQFNSILSPYIIGGTSSLSSLYGITLNSAETQMYVLGSTSDLALIGSSTLSPIVIKFDVVSGIVLWSNKYTLSSGKNYDGTSIGLSPNSAYAIVGFSSDKNSFVVLNSTDGSKVKGFYDSSHSFEFYMQSLTVDNSLNIMAFGYDQNNYVSSLVYISSSNLLISQKYQYSSTIYFHRVIPSYSGSLFYLGGNCNTYPCFACVSSTTFAWTYQYSSAVDHLVSIMYLLHLGDGTNEILTGISFDWVNGSKYQMILQIKISPQSTPISGAVYKFGAPTTDSYSKSLKVVNVNQLYTIIEYGTSSNNAEVWRVQLDQMKVFVTLLPTVPDSNIEYGYLALSSGSLNYYYVGYTTKIITNQPSTGSSKTFTKQVGFIMGSTPTASCVSLSNPENAGSSLTNNGGSFSIKSISLSNGQQISFSDRILVTPMLSISTVQVCPVTVTVTPTLISAQSFLDTNLPTTITISQFTASDSSSITYSATGLPMCCSISPSDGSISLPSTCQNGASTTTYSVIITGSISTGEYAQTLLTLTITYVSRSITAPTQNPVTFYFNQLPQTFSLLPFTFSQHAAAMSIAYTTTTLPLCGFFDSNLLTITLSNTCTGTASYSLTVSLKGTLSSVVAESQIKSFLITLLPAIITPSVIPAITIDYTQISPYNIVFPPFTYQPLATWVSFTYAISGLSGCATISTPSLTITLGLLCIPPVTTSYQVIVTGTLTTGELATSQFQLTILHSLITIYPAIVPNSLFYYTDLPQAISFNPWTYSPSGTHTFTYSVTGLPACATFDSTQLRILLPLKCASLTSGSYFVTIAGVLSTGDSQDSTFTLDLVYVPRLVIPSSQGDITLDNSDLQLEFQIQAFQSVPSLESNLFAYTLTGMMPCAQFDEQSLTFTLPTSCMVSYNQSTLITVTGTLQTLESASLTFSFIRTCSRPKIITPFIFNHDYYVYDPPLAFNFPGFASSLSCYDYNFYYQAKLSNGSALPSFINFQGDFLNVFISSNDVGSVGSYNIAVTGSLNDDLNTSAVVHWTLKVKDSPLAFLVDIKYIGLLYNETAIFVLPDVINKMGHSIEISADLGVASRFTNFTNFTFKFDPQTQQNIGIWPLRITIQDLQIKRRRTITSILLEIYEIGAQKLKQYSNEGRINISFSIPSDVSIYRNSSNLSSENSSILSGFFQKKLEVQIQKILFNGTVILSFSRQMIYPLNSSHINQSIMSLQILKPNNQLKNETEFNWSCYYYNNRQMHLQVNFSQPLNISRYPVIIRDHILEQ